MKLDKINLIISGLVKTSQLDVLEEHYKDIAETLIVIGISSPYLKAQSKCIIYKHGQIIKQFPLPTYYLGKKNILSDIILIPRYFIFLCFIFYNLRKCMRCINNKKEYCYIGISAFSSYLGTILKRFKIIKYNIYYALDFYPPSVALSSNAIIIKIASFFDKICCLNADCTWNVTESILEAREKYFKLKRNQYSYKIVPVTLPKKYFYPTQSLNGIKRDSLVFVGTLSMCQGLQLIVDSLPYILEKLPHLLVNIIGSGPDKDKIIKYAQKKNMFNKFIFHGHIEDNEKMLAIVKSSAIGLCTYTDNKDSNIVYADPGKPKLYTFCSLPVVITKVAQISTEIEKHHAGIAINYDPRQCAEAIFKILKTEEGFSEYKKGAYEFAAQYTTDNVYKKIDEKLNYI